MKKTILLSYQLELSHFIPLYNERTNAWISSLEVDILTFSDAHITPNGQDFTVTILGNEVFVECSNNALEYIVLPYTILAEIGNSQTLEKIVWGDRLEKSFLPSNKHIPRNTLFVFSGIEENNVGYHINP